MKDKLGTWEDAVVWMRHQPKYQQTVLDCFYDDPITAAAERYYRSTEWQAICAFLPMPAGIALDIGAGRGISSYALACENWQVTALEPDSSTVVGAGAIRILASQSGLPIEVLETWGESLPFPDNSFDLVHMRAVLHHARKLDVCCREAERVLKKGGIFLALREHVIDNPSDLKVFQQNHPLHKLYGGEYAYQKSEYRQAIEQAGLVLEHLINPLESDINLYPRKREDLKNILGLKIIPSKLIPDLFLRMLGIFYRKPGRLYSFVARKEGYG
jgi:ubiquinone/menaquinone biosynthesis C-methylase UbiE